MNAVGGTTLRFLEKLCSAHPSNCTNASSIGNAWVMGRKDGNNLTLVLLWASRLSVIATGLTVPFLNNALQQMSSVTGTFSTVAIWALWSIALLSTLVPSSTALTAIRLALPSISVIVGAVAIAIGVSSGVVGALAISVLASLLVMSAEIGNSFVQLAAYGDERRFLLRCPPAMLVVQVLSWLVWVALTIVAINLLASDALILGAIVAIVALLLTIALPRRFHRFSRRWLVSVPSGLVIHDHVVLAETAMFMHNAVINIGIETAQSEAADLSGKCAGIGLVITLKDFDTVVFAATPKTPGGSAIHVKSMRVCPNRPGRAITELTSAPSA